MRKSVLVLLIVALLAIAGSYVAYAAEHRDMDKGKMGMCPMHMNMCGSMMKSQIVATDDGGVIVLVCNKLMKYDKNLNVVKEVELKIDMEEKMTKMMEKCQMMCSQKSQYDKMDKEKDDKKSY